MLISLMGRAPDGSTAQVLELSANRRWLRIQIPTRYDSYETILALTASRCTPWFS